MSDDVEYSWRAIRHGQPVVSSDGETVGKVVDVAALSAEDIFHGVVFEHHALGSHLLAPAADVGRITEDFVHLKVPAQATEAYEPFHELVVEQAGLTGLFRWKHLGWSRAKE